MTSFLLLFQTLFSWFSIILCTYFAHLPHCSTAYLHWKEIHLIASLLTFSSELIVLCSLPFVGYLRSIFPRHCQLCNHNLFCLTGPYYDTRSRASGIDFMREYQPFFRSTCICQSFTVARTHVWSSTDLFGFCPSVMNRNRKIPPGLVLFCLATEPSNIFAISPNIESCLNL